MGGAGNLAAMQLARTGDAGICPCRAPSGASQQYRRRFTSWWHKYVDGRNPDSPIGAQVSGFLRGDGINPYRLPRDDLETLRRYYLRELRWEATLKQPIPRKVVEDVEDKEERAKLEKEAKEEFEKLEKEKRDSAWELVKSKKRVYFARLQQEYG